MVRVIEDCEGHRATKFSNRIAAEKSMRSARAGKYREEAARLRREAEDMKHSENRQQLLDIAAQYDRLAASAERTPLQ